MSEDLIKKFEELKVENNNLKNDLSNHKNGIDALTCQLDAHREQLNESLNTGLIARTNVIFLKKQNQTLSQQLDDLKNQHNNLNNLFESANKRIAELTTVKI